MRLINRFDGTEYDFLSNFHPSPISLYGRVYPTVEHAYQAAKAITLEESDYVGSADTPGQAKRRGNHVIAMRTDWDDVKFDVMRLLIALKFKRGSDLAERLLCTESAVLIEGNDWGDQVWGVADGSGENWLGRILMERRSALQSLHLTGKR